MFLFNIFALFTRPLTNCNLYIERMGIRHFLFILIIILINSSRICKHILVDFS